MIYKNQCYGRDFPGSAIHHGLDGLAPTSSCELIFGPTDFQGLSYKFTLVCPSVCLFGVFLENQSWNLSETWHEVRVQQQKKCDRARFFRKYLIFSKFGEICQNQSKNGIYFIYLKIQPIGVYMDMIKNWCILVDIEKKTKNQIFSKISS